MKYIIVLVGFLSVSEAARGRVRKPVPNNDDSGSLSYDYGSPPNGEVVCPGRSDLEYCAPDLGDCTFYPEYCDCEEAQDACSHVSSSDFASPDDAIVCPGKQDFEYCSVSAGDCDYFPEYCTCVEACRLASAAK